jgi:hypothetical protein
MGATATNLPEGVRPIDFLLHEEFPPDGNFEVVKYGTSPGDGEWKHVLYVAARYQQTGKVGAHVILYRVDYGRDWYGTRDRVITWKIFDETCGPCDDSAPARVLDVLDPVDEAWGIRHRPEALTERYGYDAYLTAVEWREGCRARLRKLQDSRKVEAGDVLRFAKPIEFTDGTTLDLFAFDKGSIFRSYWPHQVVEVRGERHVGAAGSRYRITNWKLLDFEVVGRVGA